MTFILKKLALRAPSTIVHVLASKKERGSLVFHVRKKKKREKQEEGKRGKKSSSFHLTLVSKVLPLLMSFLLI